jgi:hypothetical protein
MAGLEEEVFQPGYLRKVEDPATGDLRQSTIDTDVLA